MKTKTNVKAGILGFGAAASGSVAAGLDLLGLVKANVAASFSAAANVAA
jgi:hypothetical protein